MSESTPAPAKLQKIYDELARVAATYPETTQDFPWGHLAAKVKGKAFAFMATSADGVSFSFKLPRSNQAALAFPFASPTGYGLGKSGWVSVEFKKGQDVPLELLKEWLDESFRAIAPVKVLKALDGEAAPAPAKKKKKAAPKKKR